MGGAKVPVFLMPRQECNHAAQDDHHGIGEVTEPVQLSLHEKDLFAQLARVLHLVHAEHVRGLALARVLLGVRPKVLQALVVLPVAEVSADVTA